jgi:hypothetical protein
MEKEHGYWSWKKMAEDQKLITKTCDRCKESTTTKLTVADYLPGGHGGWLKIGRKKMCPKCATIFWTEFMENKPVTKTITLNDSFLSYLIYF